MEFIKKHRLLLIALGVLIIVGALVYIRPNEKKSPEKEEIRKSYSMGDYLMMMSSDKVDKSFDASGIKPYEVKRTPFIRNVILEKNTVCVGEDFLVTIESNDPEGRDADLISSIGPSMGNPVIMRFTIPGKHKIIATVRDFKRIDTKVEEIEVVECSSKPAVYLEARLHPFRMEEGEFEVMKLQNLKGNCTYEWDFGDGKSTTTTRGYTTHNYGLRDQKRFNTSYMVKVTVTDEKQVSVTARASLDFPNIQWISGHMGSMSVPVIFNRFLDSKNNEFRTDISMKNIHSQDLTFNDADITLTLCNSPGVTQNLTVNASSFMPKTNLSGGEVIRGDISFKESVVPKSACAVAVIIHGKLSDGKPVSLEMNFTIPADSMALNSKNSVEVEDHGLDRKIQMAKRILGRDYVTQDDLYTLEKEGKFND